MRKPFTDTVRKVALVMFVLTVSVALIGWLLERDPSSLAFVLAAVVAAMGVGEASNVGKRATTKPGLVDAPEAP